MTERIIIAIYASLLLVYVAVISWSFTFLVECVFLAAYFVLVYQHGLAAVRGSDQFHPFMGSLLLAAPLVLLVGCHAAAKPSPVELILVITLAPLYLLVSLLWRRRRHRKTLMRSIEGWCILATPIVVFVLFALFNRGPTGGVMMILSSWLEFSFRYAGSGVEGLWLGTAAMVGATFAISRFLLKHRLSTAIFGSLLLVHILGGYLLFVVYYDLPLDHSYEDVASQPHTQMLEMVPPRGAGRTLHIDQAERMIYLAVKTTKWPNNDRSLSGVLSYEIASQRELAFHPLTPCITMVVDEEDAVLYSCDFFERKIIQFDLKTMEPTGVELSLEMPTRPEGLVRLSDRFILIRPEIPGDGPDLLRLDTASMEVHPMRIPRRSMIVGCYALAVDASKERIFVPKLGNNTIVLNKLDVHGAFQGSVDLSGLSFEAVYSVGHDAVFVATLNRRILYRVDPDTLKFTQSRIPNGIRAIRETDDGILILGDYIRGKIYLYDPASEAIIHTLLTGKKPQGMSVAAGSGKLYVYSSFGITVFDLPRILADLEPKSV